MRDVFAFTPGSPGRPRSFNRVRDQVRPAGLAAGRLETRDGRRRFGATAPVWCTGGPGRNSDTDRGQRRSGLSREEELPVPDRVIVAGHRTRRGTHRASCADGDLQALRWVGLARGGPLAL